MKPIYFYLSSPWDLREQSREFQKRFESNFPTEERIDINDRSITEYRPISLIHPFYDFRKENVDLKNYNRIEKGKKVLGYRNGIVNFVNRDLERMRKSDGIICYAINVKEMMFTGCLFEISYARMCLDIPVYLLTNRPELIYHPWINYYCEIFKSEKELIEYFKPEPEEKCPGYPKECPECKTFARKLPPLVVGVSTPEQIILQMALEKEKKEREEGCAVWISQKKKN